MRKRSLHVVHSYTCRQQAPANQTYLAASGSVLGSAIGRGWEIHRERQALGLAGGCKLALQCVWQEGRACRALQGATRHGVRMHRSPAPERRAPRQP